jgi:glycosyltransferase involved in cell wall biosynthesis
MTQERSSMRVAHFIHRYPPAIGGSESYFARLSRYLAATGDEVTVFTTNAIDLEAFWSRGRVSKPGTNLEDGVEVRRYPLLRWPGRKYVLKPLSMIPIRAWQCMTLPCNPIAPGMWRDAGESGPRYDLVHATAFPYGWPIACGLRLAKTRGVPFLLTPFLHLGDPTDPKDRVRRAYTSPCMLRLVRAAERVFVQTELEHAALLARGMPARKLTLLGMGVHPKEVTGGNRERIRNHWGIQAGEVAIGHLANNSEEKGTVDLLRAVMRLWAGGRPVRVVLAGPEMENFRKFWLGYRPAGPVIRLGVLSEEQKRDFFAGLDVFALPSRSDSFGLVLVEAWANGLPNVAYAAGGVAEVIRHDSDGLLAPCGDVEALAASLERLVSDSELRRMLGENGKRRTVEEFSWGPKLRRVRDIYESVTGKRSPSSPSTAVNLA